MAAACWLAPAAGALGTAAPAPSTASGRPAAAGAKAGTAAMSVDSLPELAGKLTLYLGRGEGGLYEHILAAIRQRNPRLELSVRRGPSTALANTLVAEARSGRVRADLFWSIDASSLGMVARHAASVAVPDELRRQLLPGFQYSSWVPISGRVRTVRQQGADDAAN